MLSTDTLRRMAVDPGEYRRHLLIDCNGVAQPLDSVMDDFQRQDFTAMDPAWQSMAGVAVPEPTHRRAWIERSRGSSKTQDTAVSALWALAFAQRPLRGVCLAATQQQAGILKDAIDRIVCMNGWLAEVIETQRWRVTNTRTGSQLDVMASDEPSSYGWLIDFALVDELSMWATDSLWVATLSAVAKKGNSLLVAITNAGWRNSWIYKLRQKIENDPAWYFSHQTGHASWISQAQVDEQLRLLPSAQFMRLWRNIWSAAEGDAFDERQIRKLIVHDGPLYRRPPEYAGAGIGVDAGTAVHHSSVVTVLTDHVNHHVRVAEVVDLAPPVELSDVRDTILQTRDKFGANVLYFDPYQMLRVAEECAAQGMQTIPVHPSGVGVQARMAVSLMESVRNETLELYDDPLLIEDLLGCQIIERPQGLRLQLAENEHGHSDRLAALTQVLPFAASAAAVTPVRFFERVGGYIGGGPDY